MAEVVDGWIRIRANVRGLATPEVRFDTGEWIPCYVDEGDAILRVAQAPSGRRGWTLRVGGTVVGSGVLLVP